jgi:hypothetical protein
MLIPISILKKTLDNMFGANVWKEYETETLILELGLLYSDLLYDKLSVLKVIEHHPTLFFEDILFCVHATNVINNTSTDFEYLPHITSLEMAFAITELAGILNVPTHALPEFGIGITAYIREMLINEGYSDVLPPFDVVGLGALPKGQTPQDTANKDRAIKEYIHAMYNQSTS